MAWLEQRGNQFHLGIRIGEQKLKRSLRTNNLVEAQQTVDRVERRLKLIEQGDLIPPDMLTPAPKTKGGEARR